MLVNQAKNLTRIDFPELQALTQTLQEADRLMGQAQGIRFRVSGLDQQFRRHFPQSFSAALRTNDQVIAARTRLDTALSAYRHTMTVQAQVAENVASDARAWRQSSREARR
jgi:P-type conjugative transfer protein TrbJ